jgi:ADP-heptose:LPS heptosyltransferase
MSKNYFSARYIHLGIRAIVGSWLLLRHTKREAPKAPRAFAIVHNVQLGDMVCTTPVFRAIKGAFPEAQLIVAGSAINKDVLAGNTDVDEYLVYDQSNPDILSKALHERNIDVGIIPSPSLEGLLVLAYARTPYILAAKLENGMSPYNTRFYRFLCRFVVTRPHYMATYAPREYLRLLEPLDIVTEDTRKHLAVSSDAKEHISAFLTSNGIGSKDPFVCITPGAGNKIKEWPPERFAKVAEHIWENYRIPIVVIGSVVDQGEVMAMTAALATAVRSGMQLIDTCDKFSIEQLKALISRARLLIGVDTGPIYIAEAFNTPLIDIVGPVGEREQPPTGNNRICVVPPGPRIPQLHIMNARVYDATEARRQVMSTTVEIVIAAVDTLLA